MKHGKLRDMQNGWFVGDFKPSIFQSPDFEVAIKYYRKGDYEVRHKHKKATEITVVVQGEVRMNEVKYQAGDMVLIEPNEATDFLAIEDTITAVVKTPSVPDDKYVLES